MLRVIHSRHLCVSQEYVGSYKSCDVDKMEVLQGLQKPDS